ncbi:hypothetical protein GPJ56_003069 [Histomonas meleagridis]|uniref:uncharacterized protein n=1 Tax=Histomonas meleagridis TaxID=135588 RepID=UPI00355A1C2B|nr:hypothetical protein GPJ56_003069 [Histomonas meleagridis]KAH0805157.1 hypothetical protein GO595_002102 [Histomonas meleagridis]
MICINPQFQGQNSQFQFINPQFQGINPQFQGPNPQFQGQNPQFQGPNPRDQKQRNPIKSKIQGQNHKKDQQNPNPKQQQQQSQKPKRPKAARADLNDGSNVYIKGYFNIKAGTLEHIFSQYGKVVSTHINSQEHVCFVKFSTPEEAQSCIRMSIYLTNNGRQVGVSMYKQKIQDNQNLKQQLMNKIMNMGYTNIDAYMKRIKKMSGHQRNFLLSDDDVLRNWLQSIDSQIQIVNVETQE